MFEVNTYNPTDVYLIIGGGYQCSGWDEITIERSVPSFKMIKGIRGKHTRVKDSDTSAIITISVMQVHATNDVLSELHRLDIEEGTGRIELILVDKSGNSSFSSSEAFVMGYPKKVFKDGIEFVPWTIQCQSTEEFIVGGNSRPDTSLINQAIELFS